MLVFPSVVLSSLRAVIAKHVVLKQSIEMFGLLRFARNDGPEGERINDSLEGGINDSSEEKGAMTVSECFT